VQRHPRPRRHPRPDRTPESAMESEGHWNHSGLRPHIRHEREPRRPHRLRHTPTHLVHHKPHRGDLPLHHQLPLRCHRHSDHHPGRGQAHTTRVGGPPRPATRHTDIS